MAAHISSVKLYVSIFLALMAGTALTVAAAFVDMGAFNNVTAMGIAIIKATLVVLFFMHVKYSSRMTPIVVGAAVFFLALLFGLTLMDNFTRPSDFVDHTLFDTPPASTAVTGEH